MPDDPFCKVCQEEESKHGMFTGHKFEKTPMKEKDCPLEESFSVPGGLSNISVGGKTRKTMETIKPDRQFNKVVRSLVQESHNPMEIPIGKEVDEAGTSAGASKGWDKRGRGRKAEEPNEGRAVDRIKALEEGSGLVIHVENNAINPVNNLKLVHLTGDVLTVDTVTGLSTPTSNTDEQISHMLIIWYH